MINPTAPCAFAAERLAAWTKQQHAGFKLVTRGPVPFALSSGVEEFVWGIGANPMPSWAALPGLLEMGSCCFAGEGFQPPALGAQQGQSSQGM